MIFLFACSGSQSNKTDTTTELSSVVVSPSNSLSSNLPTSSDENPSNSLSSNLPISSDENPEKPQYTLGLKKEGEMKIQQLQLTGDPVVLDVINEDIKNTINNYIKTLVPLTNGIKNPNSGYRYIINVFENGEEKVYLFSSTTDDLGNHIVINYQDPDPMSKYVTNQNAYNNIEMLFDK